MPENPHAPKPSSLVAIFLTLFALVFMLVLLAATLITFILPESYASTARIKVGHPGPASGSESATQSVDYDPILAKTEAEIIQSELILGTVIEQLNLNAEWGRKFANGEKLKTTESMSILRGRLEVKPVPGTTLISVRAFSEDREESARLANAVVKSYQERAAKVSPGIVAYVVDMAYPGLKPLRPNKPLNIALGAVSGVVLGAAGGGLVTALAASQRTRKRPGPSSLPDAEPKSPR